MGSVFFFLRSGGAEFQASDTFGYRDADEVVHRVTIGLRKGGSLQAKVVWQAKKKSFVNVIFWRHLGSLQPFFDGDDI